MLMKNLNFINRLREFLNKDEACSLVNNFTTLNPKKSLI